ncbi:hypothetical protein LSH36_133g02065 [Paralvinella palmiformis]|uniref:Sulfotransferase domain-containing protein n=1 Tax=Paralvinella palmiformis TaxID=53620 RepID=A0AAD9JWR1_9ANNE|nr:hypothetical protein LSH36_133g02065 [Paralvinella palmiformis]
MSFEVYRELFITYTQWLLFLLLNVLYTSVRNISWILNGTYWRLIRNQRPENYEQCAHVMQIVYKHQLDQFIEPRISDFMLVHDRFEHPNYVLRDDVTLLTITDSRAIFLQSRKDAAPPFRHNFFVIGQWEGADKIITIPLNQFQTLAESTRRDDAQIVFLQNQSRCGGTLLTNVFLETGRCVTFNEPGAINALSKYIFIDKIWDGAETRRLFRNTVHMLCKPYRGLDGPVLAYVIKPTVTSIPCMSVIQESLPDAVQLFLYRRPVEVATSLRRLGQVIPTLKLVYYFPRLPGVVAPLLRIIGHTDVQMRGWTPRCHSDLEIGYRIASMSMYYYLKCRREGVSVTGIRYSDLVAHRDAIIRQIFERCHLTTELVAEAVKALDRDSQERTDFSQKRLKEACPNPPKVTTAFLEAARDMAKEFDVPGPEGWDPGFRLPGSIEPKAGPKAEEGEANCAP